MIARILELGSLCMCTIYTSHPLLSTEALVVVCPVCRGRGEKISCNVFVEPASLCLTS